MSTKTLNTRIQTKIDTLDNWNNSTLPLLAGEIAIATGAVKIADGLTEPVCIIRIGEDGKKTFSQLPDALHAKAIDVLPACKNEEAFIKLVNDIIKESDFASELDDIFASFNVTDAAEEGKYVSSVSQENGVIKVTRAQFPDFLQNINISIEEYEGIKECLVIKDSNSNILSYVDASRFVKDGMLDSSSYDSDTHKLTLTWNTDAGKEDTEIDLNDLVDIYQGDKGIEITSDKVVRLTDEIIRALELAHASIQAITANGADENTPSGLIATKNEENNSYNIAIDDSITFIFNCGGAGVTA